jgi:hypothetical protein
LKPLVDGGGKGYGGNSGYFDKLYGVFRTAAGKHRR